MNYIVFDMEWNQAPHPMRMIRKPVPVYGEIIQIGAVRLDEQFMPCDTLKLLIRPKYYTKMHSKVSKLTHITTQELKNGLPFPEAFRQFRDWCGEDFAFLTWGPDDIGVLRDNMLLYGLDPEWIPTSYNIQVIFDAQITQEHRQISLSAAMERVGEPEFDAHDALNDAHSTAVLCRHLDMARGIEEYTVRKKQLPVATGNFTERFTSPKSYARRSDALRDAELTTYTCPKCGASGECHGFVRQNADTFIALGKCENGDEVFVRYKFTKRGDDRFNAARLLYELDEENRAYYAGKKQAIRKRRRSKP